MQSQWCPSSRVWPLHLVDAWVMQGPLLPVAKEEPMRRSSPCRQQEWKWPCLQHSWEPPCCRWVVGDLEMPFCSLEIYVYLITQLDRGAQVCHCVHGSEERVSRSMMIDVICNHCGPGTLAYGAWNHPSVICLFCGTLCQKKGVTCTALLLSYHWALSCSFGQKKGLIFTALLLSYHWALSCTFGQKKGLTCIALLLSYHWALSCTFGQKNTAVQGLRFSCYSWAPEPRHPVHVTDVYATESRTPLVRELSADRFSVGLLLHCNPPSRVRAGGMGKGVWRQAPLWSAASAEKQRIFFLFRLQPTRHRYNLPHSTAHMNSCQSTKWHQTQ